MTRRPRRPAPALVTVEMDFTPDTKGRFSAEQQLAANRAAARWAKGTRGPLTILERAALKSYRAKFASKSERSGQPPTEAAGGDAA